MHLLGRSLDRQRLALRLYDEFRLGELFDRGHSGAVDLVEAKAGTTWSAEELRRRLYDQLCAATRGALRLDLVERDGAPAFVVSI